MQEYFAFPEKFLFFEFALGREAVRAASATLDVLLLDTVPDEDLMLERSTFRLGCTPIIIPSSPSRRCRTGGTGHGRWRRSHRGLALTRQPARPSREC